jgi:hypothetical protein
MILNVMQKIEEKKITKMTSAELLSGRKFNTSHTKKYRR